ncbi:MAG: hypothetical protein FRX49_00388 [Trebouxia sp. A1-2]|nr:MAG: hypothetical protein FRX49_00388 [Trebouxia sp. A1-2]
MSALNIVSPGVCVTRHVKYLGHMYLARLQHYFCHPKGAQNSFCKPATAVGSPAYLLCNNVVPAEDGALCITACQQYHILVCDVLCLEDFDKNQLNTHKTHSASAPVAESRMCCEWDGHQWKQTLAAGQHTHRSWDCSPTSSRLMPVSGPFKGVQRAIQLRQALARCQQLLQQAASQSRQHCLEALKGFIQGLQASEPSYHGRHSPFGIVFIQNYLHCVPTHTPTQASSIEPSKAALQVTHTCISPNGLSTFRADEILNSILAGSNVSNVQQGAAQPLAEQALASRGGAVVQGAHQATCPAPLAALYIPEAVTRRQLMLPGIAQGCPQNPGDDGLGGFAGRLEVLPVGGLPPVPGVLEGSLAGKEGL